MNRHKQKLQTAGGNTFWKRAKRDRQLWIILLPCIAFYALFRYGPMYGLIVAFKEYDIWDGLIKSDWVGFKHFIEFFHSQDFVLLFRNTLLLGLSNLVFSFPFPILFALLLNEVRIKKLKTLAQTVSYLPSFLSVVIVCSMFIDLLSPTHGLVNTILENLGFPRTYFIIKPEWFRFIYVSSGIWQSMGYSAIIYLAALSGIDKTLYEAGEIDGCGRLRAIWHITIPGILPTVITMFIISSGHIMRIGYEKVLLLYTPVTYKVADVFSTFVYRKGLENWDFSYATAVGLFESVIAIIFLFITNNISKKFTQNSIW